MSRWGLVLVLVLAASCQSPTAPPPILEPARVERSLLDDADRLFARAYAEDVYRRDGYGSPTFQRARELYLRACREGSARGCWRSMNFEFDWSGFEMQRLRELCQHGDLMACRAAQPFGKLKPGMPGYFGSIHCALDDDEDCANERALVSECLAGFPASCEQTSDPQLQERGVRLAAKGCRLGLVRECPIMGTWEDFKRRCWLSPVMCFRHSPKVRHDYPYEPRRRELAERACRLMGRKACIYLAAQYADANFPQPFPGRARELAERFCTSAQIDDPNNFCHNLSGDIQQRLAELP